LGFSIVNRSSRIDVDRAELRRREQLHRHAATIQQLPLKAPLLVVARRNSPMERTERMEHLPFLKSSAHFGVRAAKARIGETEKR